MDQPLNDSDRRAFAELLTATMQVYGAALGSSAIGIWWASLSSYSLPAVRAALSAHVTDPERGRFAPKPADIIAHLIEGDGRPGADEAWSLCPMSESQTVVWTEEASAAFFGAALGLLEDGDRVAARMAFKDAYQKQVAKARRERTPIKWVVSLGLDVRGREPVLLEAVERGRLPASRLPVLLPHVGTPDARVMELRKPKTEMVKT